MENKFWLIIDSLLAIIEEVEIQLSNSSKSAAITSSFSDSDELQVVASLSSPLSSISVSSWVSVVYWVFYSFFPFCYKFFLDSKIANLLRDPL